MTARMFMTSRIIKVLGHDLRSGSLWANIARANQNCSRFFIQEILQELNPKFMKKRSNFSRPKTNGRKPHRGSDKTNKILLAATGGVITAFPQQAPHQPTYQLNPTGFYIDYNTFLYQLLAKGEVDRIIVTENTNVIIVVLHEGAKINGMGVPSKNLILRVPNSDQFERKLRNFERSIGIPPGAGLLYLLFSNKKLLSSNNMMSSLTRAKFTLVNPTSRAGDPASIRFKDVAGLQEAKVEVMEFVDYLKDPEKFLKLGAKLPKGVLLTGPPGCGKTLLAKAVATESNVPFLALSGSDFVEMIGGLGASRVRSLFKDAKKLAPCIIYIDEIDSIGKKRGGSQMYNGEMEQTLNQLLVEMDGMVSRKSVILLASTNRADVLDNALIRPGRFDRQILIDLPNLSERREIFEKHATKIKLEGDSSNIALRIAQLTPGMSGADLANVCNEAALHAARKNKKFVSKDDLEYAIERVVGGTEKRSSSMSETERRMVAYHESGHALVGWLLEHTDPILKVSIVARTSNALGFTQYLPLENKLHTPEQFNDKLCMLLGGRVAELLKFNHLSTGAQDDLKKITQMAKAQITQYGFDPVVGHLSFPKEEETFKRPYSKRLANVIDTRASVIVSGAFQRTQKVLSDNMDKLNALAEALIAKEVLNSDDIENLIGPSPHKKTGAQNK